MRAAYSALLILAASPLVLGQGRTHRATEIINGHEAVAGEVLVKFRGRTAPALQPDLAVTARQKLHDGWERVRGNRRAAELMAALAARSDVAYAEPNYVIRAEALPNDPNFSTAWHLRNPARPGADVHASTAWDLTTGSRGNVVAVIDSGIEYTHPDLKANVWSAPAAFSVVVGGNTVSCPAGSHGYNAVSQTCDPMDDYGHGTEMAGIIGAAGNNAVGVTGVSWRASLMALKFMDADGVGSTSGAIDAIEFAIQVKNRFAGESGANVRILSNSWGYYTFSQALADEIARADAQDMLFVASAGNDTRDVDAEPHYPSGYDAPNLLSITATNQNDERSGYANYGATTVDAAAPGDNIMSTTLGGGYATHDGTSNAAAVASGVAGLVLAGCPMTTPQLRQALLDGVDPIPTLQSASTSGGRLDADRSLRLCRGLNSPPTITLTAPAASSRVTAPTSVVVSASASDSDGQIVRVDFYVDGTLIASDTTSPYRVSWAANVSGQYAFSAVAIDDGGASTRATDTRIVTVNPPASAISAPWFTLDVTDAGFDGAPGAASAANGTFSLQGPGGDLWSSSDAFRFVYQPLQGDGQIVARVASIQDVNAWSKAGVMMRTSLDAGAANAFMLVSAAKGVAFQRRLTAGGATSSTLASGSAPTWLRLVRQGQTLIASRSADGNSWTEVGRETFALPSTLYVGLAAASHDVLHAAAATFTNVTLGAAAAGSNAVSTLPSGWQSADVGATGRAGAATATSGVYTMQGAGADIWGASDAFRFAYYSLAGDGSVTARVVTVQNVDAWTKAGVMIRQNLDAGSAHASLLVTPGKGIAFQRRQAAGAVTVSTQVTGSAPRWVRVTRKGTLFTAATSSDGATWATVGQDTIAISGTARVGLVVSSHDAATLATATFDNVRVAASPSWSDADVGAVGVVGASSTTGVAAGAINVSGSGADIWGSADAFHFRWRTLSGDGELTARVDTLQNTSRWAKAGVMIRQSGAAGSPHAMIVVSPGMGTAFQYRTASGGASASVPGPADAAPIYLRIVRKGNTITGYQSADGASWTALGSTTIALPATVQIGLAVTSHDNTRTATALFDHVK